jgi:hypothetical protein
MRSRGLLSAFCVCALGLPAFGQKTQMRVTALEYHKNDTDAPYHVDGQTSPPGAVLYYRLGCKKGAADLHVGDNYRIEESTADDGTKLLSIYYKEPLPNKSIEGTTVVGVACTVESVKVK